MTLSSTFISNSGNTQRLTNLSPPLMEQQQTSLNLVPASSTPSYNRSASISLPSPPLDDEDLWDNRFYVYLRSQFSTIFTNYSVVCVPHSRYLEGRHLTKEFIETHCYNASPYYRDQYQSGNKKVISIELPKLYTVSGFKEQRTIYIMSEEWVYIGPKKIHVYMIQGLLEGEALDYQKYRNKINIPPSSNSKSDLGFLNLFAENAQSLVELKSDVQKFVGTFVYIRGFSSYTVEMIQHIYTKAYTTILQRNKLIRDACQNQSEHEHFVELVENAVMGLLHEKIWIQSLRSILQTEDNHISLICERYSNTNVTLQKYSVSQAISQMPLSCFDKAITCLRRTDANTGTPNYITNNIHPTTSILSNDLAFTPLEKIACIKTTMDLISAAVDDYVEGTTNRTKYMESYVTTDEMIPLMAYVIAHSRISRMASLIFYVEQFRLSPTERPEHGFALATMRAAVSFLERDPLSLLKTSSIDSTPTANTASSTPFSVHLQNIRSKSTPSNSPMTSPTLSISHNTPVHNHYPATDSDQLSHQQQIRASKSVFTSPCLSSAPTLNIIGSNLQRTTGGGPLHRKSQSANSPNATNEQKHSHNRSPKQRQQSTPSSSSSSSSTSIDSCRDDDYTIPINAAISRHHSLTPKNCSEVYVQNTYETQQSYDWILCNDDVNKTIGNRITSTSGTSSASQHEHRTPTQQQRLHPTSINPPKHILEITQPIISATIPYISNSTPILGNGHSPPKLSSMLPISSNRHYQRQQHQQNECHTMSSLKHNDSAGTAMATQLENTSNGGTIQDQESAAGSTTSPKSTAVTSPNVSWQFTLPALSNLPYCNQSSLNDLDDANKKLNQSLSPTITTKKASHSQPKATTTTVPPFRPLNTTTTATTKFSPQRPPNVITINNRLSFDDSTLGRRPSSICLDARSFSSSSSSSSIHGRIRDSEGSQEGLGDFLLGLQKWDGAIIGESNGQVFRMC